MMMDMMNMSAGVMAAAMMVLWAMLGLFVIFGIVVLAMVYQAAQEAREFYRRANDEHRASQQRD